MKKRFVSLLLAISMVLTFLPVSAITAWAEDGKVVKKGNCGINDGSNVTYTLTQNNDDDLNKTYTLTISGTGEMNNYYNKYYTPWTDYMDQITSLIITGNITYIGKYAFCGFKNLTGTVEIPNTVTSIGESAFNEDSGLSKVLLSNSLTQIGAYCFGGCENLKDVILPDGLRQIWTNAFYRCSSLKEIVIPSTVDRMAGKTFGDIPNLKIYYEANLKNGSVNYDGLTVAENGNATIEYDNQTPIPVFYRCNVYLDGNQSTLSSDCTVQLVSVYYSEKVTDTKANNLTAMPVPTRSGYEFTGWYKDRTTQTKFDADNTPITGDTTLYAGWAKNVDVTVSAGVTVTVEGENPVTADGNAIQVTQGKKVTLTAGNYDPNYKYDWTCTGATGTASTGDHGKTFEFTVGTDNVNVTLASALRKHKFTVSGDVTVTVDGTEVQPDENNQIEVELTKEIALTVKDPKYGDTYKWSVNGVENTTDVTNDGKTLTLTVDDQLNTIDLATTKYTYTTGDFDVSDVNDCTYDGKEHPATVTPKADHGIAQSDYTVEYKKDGETDSKPDAPKDAGTYTVIIKKGNTEIEGPSFTIEPKAPGKDDFTVTLPDGVKEDAKASQKQATAEVKKDSLLNENGVTIDYSYRKVNEDGSKTTVDAPTDAGKYEYVATIKSTNPNVSSGEVSWPFTIDKKAEQPGGDSGNKPGDGGNTDPTPKPEEKPDRKMKIDGGIVEVNGKEVKPDEDGNITVKEGDEITITFDKSTLSDAQVFDQWTIKPDSVLNEIDPKSEKISFKMPAETVTVEAMTRDATIEDDGPGILGTGAMIATVGISAAALAYQGHMLGTEFALRCMLPEWALIPQNRAELAVLLWSDADSPEPVSTNLYSDISEDDSAVQKAARWAVENDLMELLDAEEAPENFDPFVPVTYLDSIHAWKKAQELKK